LLCCLSPGSASPVVANEHSFQPQESRRARQVNRPTKHTQARRLPFLKALYLVPTFWTIQPRTTYKFFTRKQSKTMSSAAAGGDGGGGGGIAASVLQSRRALYVGGLADTVAEPTLRAALVPFGPLKSLDVPMDYAKGTHKGFAFVEYEDADDAAEAIYNLDGAELMGRTLTVNLAQQNQAKLGSAKPVWSTDEWFQDQVTGEKGEAERRDKEERDAADASALKEKSLAAA